MSIKSTTANKTHYFLLGEIDKTEVRRIARELNLPVAE